MCMYILFCKLLIYSFSGNLFKTFTIDNLYTYTLKILSQAQDFTTMEI